jgi:rsbT co-antagonist protein RsbR
MTSDQIARYAEATAQMIGIRGEEPRARVMGMLRALDLAEEEGARVIAEGLRRGLFTENAASLVGTARPKDVIPDLQGAHEKNMPSDGEVLPVILDHMPIVMWAITPDGLFVRYEGKGIERLGVERGFLVGKNYFELFSNHGSAPDVHCALAGGSSHSFTIYEGVPYENWCAPVRDAQGNIKWVVFVSLDITEAKRTEQELRAKMELVEQQQRVIRELATPIIQVWDRVLTLPLLGVVDSGRAAGLLEGLLEQVTRTQARFAILDLTGVQAIDTATANALLQLVQALRLLGAEGIIAGIQPAVAQTMITLGVSLEGITTRANLRSALELCMRLMRAEAR